ncbi:MAG: glycosyltransferase [Planctomycetota bacterium]|nr:MAG: glycosyltransferase [Planctomycetota bacterium]
MPSVVIPAYNEANGIERCIRAVLRDGNRRLSCCCGAERLP